MDSPLISTSVTDTKPDSVWRCLTEQGTLADLEPLVSIIINNYNYARFLGSAIDSALAQTYSNSEVIVVDDGSVDDSCEVIRRYGDRVSSILKQNGGQASAMNAGFAASHGEIVMFLDADDMLLPTTVQHVVTAFRAQPQVAKVQYRMEVIDAGGTPTGLIKPPVHQPLPDGDLKRYILTNPFDLTWMATSGNAFAARVLRQIFPIPEPAFRILADFYLVHLTPLFGPVISLQETGAYYRLHGANQYELADARLNLAQIYHTITHAAHTHHYIKHFADRLYLAGRPRRADDLLSVSLIAQRLISLKLDPASHPISGDTVGRLVRHGTHAAFRRFDVSLLMKLIFLFWFVAMGLAPRSLGRWLAEKFLFPETRLGLNQLLRRMDCR